VGGRSRKSTRFGLLKDDVVVALNGYRVRNSEQYQCAWTFTDDPEATVIVWRADPIAPVASAAPPAPVASAPPPGASPSPPQTGRYLEIKGQMKRTSYGRVAEGKTR
jgi:hypothetical protein